MVIKMKREVPVIKRVNTSIKPQWRFVVLGCKNEILGLPFLNIHFEAKLN